MSTSRTDAAHSPLALSGTAGARPPHTLAGVLGFKIPLLLLALVATNLLLGYDLFARALGGRLVKVDSWDAVPAQRVTPSEAIGKEVLAQPWAKESDPSRRISAALRWVATRNADSPKCSRIADEFREALGALGEDSRKLTLFRNLFDPYDTHVAVEVRMDGKWVVFDPTFGISFVSRSGAPLSAFDVKRTLFKDGPEGLRIQPVDSTWNADRLKGFYIHPFQYYNNVFVLTRKDAPLWAAIPPLRFWTGPQLCFQATEKESVVHIAVANRLYFLVTVLLPVLELALAGLLGWRGFRALRERRTLRA